MGRPKNVFIHESGHVDLPCVIGEGTKIWHYCHVMREARIGRNCILGQNVFVGAGVTIGNNVKIQNNVSVYSGVTLEDDVFCGPSTVFTNVINPRSEITRTSEYQSKRIGRGATLGANCTILCGHDVGRYAFVGAGAVVTKSVPPYALIVGVPARHTAWVCRCGGRLRTAPSVLTCSTCQASYEETDGSLRPLER